LVILEECVDEDFFFSAVLDWLTMYAQALDRAIERKPK
jgi:hypothetical protein